MSDVVFPLFLRLSGRHVVVIGAGEVATRKVADLLENGALVTVVAPRATEALAARAAKGQLALHRRAFEPADLDGAWLAFAATDDAEAQRTVARIAAEKRVWLVAVDDVDNASAFGGAVLRRPPFLIAISSSGATPALTRLVREVLESALPEESWVSAARALRAGWKARGTPMSARFAELVRAFSERSR
jgi:siroheme synthase-like protein